MANTDAILLHVAPFLLVVFRLTGLYVFSPILGSAIVPPFVKAHLAIALAIVIYPACPAAQVTGIPLDVFMLAPLLAMETLIGYLIGWIASFPIVSVQMSGVLMGRQMGLGLAQFFDPNTNSNSNVVAQVLFYIAMAAFIFSGGLEAMVAALLVTFETTPPGGFRVEMPLIVMVKGLLLDSYMLAVRVAAPVYGVIFLQTLAVGFLSKTSPQLNIISFGFPMRVISGMIGFIASLGVMYVVLSEEMGRNLELLGRWALGMQGGGVYSG
jgi:flagellar biosynthetic protein FliR